MVSLGTSENMEDCSHEEADTRILVHLLDAVKKNRKKIIIRTVDTDVVTILIGQFYSLIVHHPDIDIWVAFGMGKSFRHYSINYICNELGEDKSRALPVFHCFTGSDTTSCFFGKGKRSAWKTWKSYPDATSAFLYMGDNPFHPVDGTSHYVKCLERFTVLLYDVTSNHDGVNEARRELFSKKSRELQNIPPTQVTQSCSWKCSNITTSTSALE